VEIKIPKRTRFPESGVQLNSEQIRMKKGRLKLLLSIIMDKSRVTGEGRWKEGRYRVSVTCFRNMKFIVPPFFV
jgi:hypothetical protein